MSTSKLSKSRNALNSSGNPPRTGSRSSVSSLNMSSSSGKLNRTRSPSKPGTGNDGGAPPSAGGDMPGDAAEQAAADAPPEYIFSIPETLPEGSLALFLSTATVDLFQLKEMCTEAKPYTFLKRADLLSDLFNRAAVSDFSPLKAQLNQELPFEEILLIQDLEWKYGQNYIICLTEAAKDVFLQLPKKPETADVVDPEAAAAQVKSQRPPTWVCLGSDREIDEERVLPSRDPIFYKMSRKRRKFGLETRFQDYDCTTGWFDLRPNPAIAHTLHRMQMSAGVQAINPMVSSAAQTTWNRKVNSSMQYEPLEMDEEQCEQMLANDLFKSRVEIAADKLEKVLLQNTVMNIFQNDFVQLGEEEHALDQGTHSSLQEYQSFTDLKYSKDKSISCVAWHPNQKGVLAVSCAQRSTLEERVQSGFSIRSRQSIVLIWSFYDPIHPQLILEASEDVSSFAFHPLLPHVIAGGCVNGQIVIWDISEFQEKMKNKKRDENEENKNVDVDVIRFVAVSSVEYSHRGAVTDVTWTSLELNHNGEVPKTERDEPGIYQLVSVGLDGNVMFWDTRYKKDLKSLDQAWRPTFKVPLLSMDGTFDYGLTRVALDSSAIPRLGHQVPPSSAGGNAPQTPSRVWCATEEGDVIQADWLLEKQDGGEKGASRVESVSGVHYGPVSDVIRSPHFSDILLSVGGWSCNIWQDRSSTPLLSSSLSTVHLTCGAWSPTRPGVFFVGRSDGFVEIWDILDRTHQASQIQAISSSSISAINVQTYYNKSHPSQQFIAIGDDDGTVHVLEVPRNIFRPGKNERAFIRALLDREIKRVAFAAERRTFRVQEKQKAAEPKAEGAPEKEDPKASSPLDGDALEKQFQDLQAATLEALSGAA
ncbi:hypothetical protein H9P43_001170 [Blastocladiella emersonii ATCC 22665]|nr:hypothetical protein H9P43_001170 [Blastocladiella emersonii ATCC 22665]